eukprot:3545928-Amphidinium_carterae.1
MWKKYRVLNAMVADIRFATVSDTCNPKTLEWEHACQMHPPPSKVWPRWIHALVTYAVQHVADFTAKLH